MQPLRFLLDTNSLSAAIKQPRGRLVKRMAQAGSSELCTSIIVAFELRYGVMKKASTQLNSAVTGLLQRILILPLDSGVEARYAALRCDLEAKGTTIGANDQLIAAHALALDLILVTDNVEEFSRVPDLRVENWLNT